MDGACPYWAFQHTAARRRLVAEISAPYFAFIVSTHSRPKAAGRMRFGTCSVSTVSTHSRPKAAGVITFNILADKFVSTHSRPKAAGGRSGKRKGVKGVSTHSRPKAAGCRRRRYRCTATVSTHSRPKAAGASLKSLAPSGFATPISLSSQEKREREYNTAFSVAPEFAIS